MNLQTKLIVCFLFLSFIPIILLSSLIFHNANTRLTAEAVHRDELLVNHKASELQNLIDDSENLTKAMVGLPSISEIIAGENTKINVEKIFVMLIDAHPYIEKLVLARPDGHEIVRVGYRNDIPFIFPENNLSDLSSRYYFKEAMSLGKGQTYISDIDLLEENNVIANPHMPVIRFAVPIFGNRGDKGDSNSTPRALIILAVDLRAAFDMLKISDTGTALMTDENGFILIHPDMSRAFSRQLGHPDNYFSRHPELAKAIAGSEASSFYDENSRQYLIWNKVHFDQRHPERYLLVADIIQYDDLFQKSHEFRRVTVILIIIFSFFSSGAVYLVSKTLSRPITRITEAAKAIAGGNMDTVITERYEPDPSDEIDRLVQAIRAMRASLKEARDRTDKEFEAIKRLDQAKDEFISTVSHEIRTPLTTIQGGLDNLQLGVVGPLSVPQIQLVEMIRLNALRLSRIVKDTLDLARLQSGRSLIKPQPVPVISLFEEIVQNFTEESRKKRISLAADAAGNLDVYADRDLIMQVLTNLVANAFRFAKEKITLKAEDRKGDVLISVIDDGIGIAKSDQSKLFSKFRQIHRAEGGSGYKGTGLGLAICKEIIERHGGVIGVDSELNQGAQFHFTLPPSPKRDKL